MSNERQDMEELRAAYAEHVAEGASLHCEPLDWATWLAIELESREHDHD